MPTWTTRLALALLLIQAPSKITPTLALPVTYYGMCDASAAVALGSGLFVVANDEDNVIRAYRRDRAATPVSSIDLSKFLNVKPGLETDLEGAARLGDEVYWIASHGRGSRGQESPSRQRFFATTVAASGDGVTLTPVGHAYTQLLRDLSEDPRLKAFGLDAASKLAPKQPGGLNIEGLTATSEGHLLLGFRNPIPRGGALLVPLLNPAALVHGERAVFGDPQLLDLSGRGIRSVAWANGKYFVIAGSYTDDADSQLYEWAGPGTKPTLIESVSFAGANPEGIAFDEGDGAHDVFVLSDDGTLQVDGADCKRLKDPMKRRFRAYRLTY